MVMLRRIVSEDISMACVVILLSIICDACSIMSIICLLFMITCSMFCMTWPNHLREINMYLLMSKNYDQETTCKIVFFNSKSLFPKGFKIHIRIKDLNLV